MENFKFYHYNPSLPAAGVFAGLFAITSGIHFYQMIRTRTWFMIPFCIGGLCKQQGEVIGYASRAYSASQPSGEWTLGPYVIQSCLILIAPALFAASVYMSLGRIVEAVEGDEFLLIRRRWLTAVFVTVDVLSFLVQSGGAGILASSTSSSSSGQTLIIVGLFIQIVGFGFFVAATVLTHLRIRKAGTQKSHEVPWSKHIVAIYAVSSLILIRSIFRTVEYLGGQDGYLLVNEIFLYVFDSALILMAMVIWCGIHPSEIKSYLKGGLWAKGLKMRAVPSAIVSEKSASQRSVV